MIMSTVLYVAVLPDVHHSPRHWVDGIPGSMTAEEGDDYTEEDEAEIDLATHLPFGPESLNLKKIAISFSGAQKLYTYALKGQ